MDYLVAVLLPQLLHGLVFGAALGLLALGLTVIFGLLGVMNFAHGELYMMGAYAGIAVIGLTGSFWLALIAAPVIVGVLGANSKTASAAQPIYCFTRKAKVSMRLSTWLAMSKSGQRTGIFRITTHSRQLKIPSVLNRARCARCAAAVSFRMQKSYQRLIARSSSPRWSSLIWGFAVWSREMHLRRFVR